MVTASCCPSNSKLLWKVASLFCVCHVCTSVSSAWEMFLDKTCLTGREKYQAKQNAGLFQDGSVTTLAGALMLPC